MFWVRAKLNINGKLLLSIVLGRPMRDNMELNVATMPTHSTNTFPPFSQIDRLNMKGYSPLFAQTTLQTLH